MKLLIRTTLVAGATLLLAASVHSQDTAATPQPQATAAPVQPAQVPAVPLQSIPAPAGPSTEVESTYEFMFFSVLEGMYRDGVSSADVKVLVARNGKSTYGGYLNFISGCPICTPARDAMLVYQQRPLPDTSGKFPTKQRTYDDEESTIGNGLPKEVSAALRSTKREERLQAVHDLISKWVSWRMDNLVMTADQKQKLIGELKWGMKQGSRYTFVTDKATREAAAPGYLPGDQCVICSGALQMPMKLKQQ